MLPVFRVRAFRIIEQEVVVVPGIDVASAMSRPLLARIAAIAELCHVAFTAEWAGDSHCL
jgi:hypothetical protein